MLKLKFTKTDLSGNTTAFIWNKIKRNQQPKIARQLMNPDVLDVEQVGFIEESINPKAKARLQMMGGEISLNATLSLVFILAKKVAQKKFSLELSGYPSLVRCQMTKNWPEIILKPLKKIKKVKLKINNSIQSIKLVNLGGIAYFIIDENLYSKKLNYQKEFKKIRNQVRNIIFPQAWGIIFYQQNKIQPLVYVVKTNSLVNENACGSGSLAFSLAENYEEVLQPSGKIIKVRKIKNKVSISGEAKLIREGIVSLSRKMIL